MTVVILGESSTDRGSLVPKLPARARHWFLSLCCALLIAGAFSLSQSLITGDSRFVLVWGLLPVLPALLFVFLELRHVRSLDELQRLIYLESLLYGSMTMVVACLVAAVLQRVGRFGPMNPFWPVGAHAVGSAVGYYISSSRFR